MSLNLVQALPLDSITSLVRKAAYGLVTTCIIGTAVYAGYRVAAPERYSFKRHRHPELNDQVRNQLMRYISSFNTFFGVNSTFFRSDR
jgi:hypothetical protein